MLALEWKPGLDMGIAIAAILAVLGTVTLIAFMTSLVINKLHPLIALRGGIKTHSFKSNPLPLDKAHGNLNFLLALKQLLQSKRQAVTITVIIASVTMASVACMAVNYNLNENREGFAKSLFGELPEVNLTLNNSENSEEFVERMREHSGVRKIFGYHVADVTILVDEVSVVPVVAEDTTLLEGQVLLDGIYPRHNNEIALGTPTAPTPGKPLNATVVVRYGDTEKEFIVTGLVQYMNNAGFNGIITGDGLRRVNPDFEFSAFSVYLNEGVDTDAFIEEVESREGNIFKSISNMSEQAIGIIETAGSVFAAVAVGVVAVTGIIVVLVLYIVIKTIILKRRRELGIQKAVGFTTFQLMNQIALNMTPVILVGVIIGAFAGYFGTNPMMAAMMSASGIVKVNLFAPIDQTIMVSVALVALAYVVSLVVAWRIRKISAYALVTE
jgi:putative ABC transport system permease protein